VLETTKQVHQSKISEDALLLRQEHAPATAAVAAANQLLTSCAAALQS
jgi:hypothetical protein